MHGWAGLFLAAALAMTAGTGAWTVAQEKQAPDAGEQGRQGGRQPLAVQTAEEGNQLRQFIMYPTGERETSVLMIEKTGPAEVRAGQPYEYQIRVTNLTEAPLAGVIVRQSLPHGISIDSAQPQVSRLFNAPPSTRPSQRQQMAQGAATQPSGDQQQKQTQQQQTARGATTQPSGEQQQGQREFATAIWQVGELMGGQTRTIDVRAFASNVGTIPSCISADYEPTLCTFVRVVNPQLRLTKSGSQRADLCEPLTYKYTIANTGSGAAQNVRIQDPLPQGLATEDGKQQVDIEVGELQAGQSRDFNVALKPSRSGEFASRAVAMSDSDKVYSDRVATQVVAPELAVKIDAPQSQYINERFTYNVTVTNNGDAPAEQTVLKLDVGDGAEFVRIPTGEGEQGEAQVAAGQVEGDVDQGDAVNVGTIQPGQSKTLRLTFVGREQGQTSIGATANAACAQAAQASARTFIATIPALQLWVVDAEDPVKVGGETTYIVSLRNEGTGPARNVSLSGTLPQGMSFVSGTGESDVQAKGQNVNFGSIKMIDAGQQLQWRVRAKAQQAGDVQFKIQLKSDDTSQPVISSEPTKLFK